MRARLVFAIAATLIGSHAAAQVYKCTESGRTIYSGQPCAADAAPITVTPAAGHGSTGDADRARMRAQREAAEVRRLDRQLEAAKAARAAQVSIGETDRCREIAQKRASSERLAKEYSVPSNIRREQEKAEHYAVRDFFECGRGNLK